MCSCREHSFSTSFIFSPHGLGKGRDNHGGSIVCCGIGMTDNFQPHVSYSCDPAKGGSSFIKQPGHFQRFTEHDINISNHNFSGSGNVTAGIDFATESGGFHSGCPGFLRFFPNFGQSGLIAMCQRRMGF